MRPDRRECCGGMLAGLALAASGGWARGAASSARSELRIGLLRFGAVSWEIDTIRRLGLDEAAGLTMTPVEYAASPATQVALQAGEVDIVALDWLWVARQRANGASFVFAPLSSAVGAIVVPATSPIRSAGDLKGKRLGVAGSAIDKSWLILCAYARQQFGYDPDAECDKSFAAPPLLAAELAAGRLDAALTYWPYVAKAEATGQHVVSTVEDWLQGLGMPAHLPMVGYVVAQHFAEANAERISGFLQAGLQARRAIAQSEDGWAHVAPATGAENPQELAALRRLYTAGIVGETAMNPNEIAAAAKLYEILGTIGGAALAGRAATLPAGTFWQPSAG